MFPRRLRRRRSLSGFRASPTPRECSRFLRTESREHKPSEPSLTLSLQPLLLFETQRVYYVREDIMKRATSVARDQLVSLGVCVGKFTHSDKFRLTIGALELLAAHAKHKVRSPIPLFALRCSRTTFRITTRRLESPPFLGGGARVFSPPRRSRRPVMRRISVFNLNFCDEKRLIPRALEGRRETRTRTRRDSCVPLRNGELSTRTNGS